MGKKAYFFLIDSILALGVLAIGAFLVFTFYVKQPSSISADILSDDIMSFFANNKISNINYPGIGLAGTYWSSNDVISCNGGPITPDLESTLLQQIAIFYETGKSKGIPGGGDCYITIARTFVEKLTQSALPSQYKFEFWINEGLAKKLIYSSEGEYIQESASKAAAKVLIPSKKIVYGILDQETGDVFGPYNAEVLVWR